jgi:hypothetical protein
MGRVDKSGRRVCHQAGCRRDNCGWRAREATRLPGSANSTARQPAPLSECCMRGAAGTLCDRTTLADFETWFLRPAPTLRIRPPNVARKSNFLACGNKTKPGGRPSCDCEKRNRRYLQPIITKDNFQAGLGLHMQCSARLRQRAFLVVSIVLQPVGSGAMGDSDRRESR